MNSEALKDKLKFAEDCSRHGEHQTALSIYDAVLDEHQGLAGVYVNRGNSLQALGRHEEALSAFDKAIALVPNDPISHFNRANVLRQLGRQQVALDAYRKAIDLKPNFYEAHLNCGILLKEANLFEAALSAYRQALKENPDAFLAHYNSGIVLQHLGHLEEALNAYGKALELKPKFAKANNNIGNILRKLGREQDAFHSFRQALENDPTSSETLSNLGDLFRGWGKLKHALGYLDKAIRANPRLAVAHLNRAATLKELGYLQQARQAAESAICINPNYAKAYLNYAVILTTLGRSQDARSAFNKAIALRPKYAAAHSNRLFALHYWEESVDGDIFKAACEFREEFGLSDGEAVPFNCPSQHQSDHQRLRIGYVSADFRSHSVGFFLQAVFNHHNAETFEIFCYYNNSQWDDLTSSFSQKSSQWRDIFGLEEQAIVDQIKADKIDILVDLSGHSAGNRLLVFAKRPAPVQVSWLGYFGTTAVTGMDFVLGDKWVTPEGCENQFFESILRLPHCYLCYTPPRAAVNMQKATESPGALVFGCFNNIAKLSDVAISLWSRILNQTSNSKLILKDKCFIEIETQDQVWKKFAAFGIGKERLLLEQAGARKDYLADYNRVDIALDPTPYGGGTTTADALWMGVPVVTLFGKTWVGRISSSILSAIGLTELIAKNEQQYIVIASQLASSPERRTELRKTLRKKVTNSVFCDGALFTANLEKIYREIWRDWRLRE